MLARCATHRMAASFIVLRCDVDWLLRFLSSSMDRPAMVRTTLALRKTNTAHDVERLASQPDLLQSHAL